MTWLYLNIAYTLLLRRAFAVPTMCILSHQAMSLVAIGSLHSTLVDPLHKTWKLIINQHPRHA
jgi:hypothetical protein